MTHLRVTVVTFLSAVLLACGLNAPAQAYDAGTVPSSTHAAAEVPTPETTRAGAIVALQKPRRQQEGVADPVSAGWCSWISACVSFNRIEQQIIAAGGGASLIWAICAVSAGLACGVAGTVVAMAQTWIGARGGICPTSAPTLRVVLRTGQMSCVG